MKNILLGTTGLVGAVLLAASASAETPKVTVGGFIDFQAGFANDDLDAAQRAQGFRNDSEVGVRVDGKSDSGLGYGAVIDLEADVTADSDNQGLNASRTYVYLDGGWGRFELGSNQGASSALSVALRKSLLLPVVSTVLGPTLQTQLVVTTFLPQNCRSFMVLPLLWAVKRPTTSIKSPTILHASLASNWVCLMLLMEPIVVKPLPALIQLLVA